MLAMRACGAAPRCLIGTPVLRHRLTSTPPVMASFTPQMGARAFYSGVTYVCLRSMDSGSGYPSTTDPSLLKHALRMSESDLDRVGGGDGSMGPPVADSDDQKQPQPGTSDEDAFGEADPMQAMANVARAQLERQRASEQGDGGGGSSDDTVVRSARRAVEPHSATQAATEEAMGGEGEQQALRRRRRSGCAADASDTTKVSRSKKGGASDDGMSTRGDVSVDMVSVAGTAASEAVVEQSKSRRHRRRRRSVDAILGDVLHDALKLRDMGHKPTADFVYQRSQERMYEEEYGHKPPSAKDHAMKFIPFPPDANLHRLLLLERPDGGGGGGSGAPVRTVDGEEETVENTMQYSKNYMHTYRFLPEDPWPERAITLANPVWSRRMVEQDKKSTAGQGLKDWETRMYQPREGYDTVGEFCDAMDELAYWESRLLVYLRDVPLTQRRSLPYLHEFHRLYVHRTIRAEKRYIATRNAVMLAVFRAPAAKSNSNGSSDELQSSSSATEARTPEDVLKDNVAEQTAGRTPAGRSFFNRTEEAVERVRSIYAEAHRSLSSPNYDPLRMRKSALAPFMRMSAAEFEEWRAVQSQRRNALVAELS